MTILKIMMLQLFNLMETLLLPTVMMTKLRTISAVTILLIVQTMILMKKHFLTLSLSTYTRYLDRIPLMGSLSD